MISTPINVEQFRSLIGDRVIGRQIRYMDSVDSTMSIAKSLIDADGLSTQELCGTVIVAEEQTAGRGRRGRSWETPHGVALLTSTIVAEPYLPANPAWLPMIAALAAARGIEQSIMAAQGDVAVKWPNDLLLPEKEHCAKEHCAKEHCEAGRAEKVAGILIETVFEQSKLKFAIIGIGINVNQTRKQLPSPLFGAPNPTSLRLYLNKAIDRTELLAHLCQELSDLLKSPDAAPQIFSAWRNRLHTLNRDVSVFDKMGQAAPALQGRAIDVTVDGELVVEDEHRIRHRITAGDVSVRHS